MGRDTPPRLARFMLALAFDEEHRQFALADLDDDFERDVQQMGVRQARSRYRAQVLRSFGPAIQLRLRQLLKTSPGRRSGQSNHRSTTQPNGGFGMRHLVADVRYACRTLLKTPIAMLVTVTSLGIGIGAATFVFTVTNALMFHAPSGVSSASGLVSIYTSDEDLYDGNSFPDYRSIVESVSSFDGVTAIRFGAVNLSDEKPPRRLFAEIVAGNYFSVLGVSLPLGRGFLPEESLIGAAERVVVISDRLWKEQFGGDPGALGQSLRLDGHSFTVVGVAPPGMVSRILSFKVDVWVPLGIPGGTFRATPQALANRGDRDFQVVAQLADGASVARAQAELTVLAENLNAAYPEEWQDQQGDSRVLTVLSDEESRLPPPMKAVLGTLSALLFSVAGMILLIACSNVAGIFLARANQRRREMAVRVSLGASRRRLIGMLLTESLIPAVAGGLLGIAVAVGATRTLETVQLPIGIPLEFDFALDSRVLLFATLLSLAASLVFGLTPALQASRPDLVPSLKNVSGTSGKRPGKFGMRNLLVVAQVASSLVLLVGAGVAIRTLQSATAVDLGFSPERAAIMSKTLANNEALPDDIVRAAKEHQAQLEALADVEAAHVVATAEGTIIANLSTAEVVVSDGPTGDTSPPSIPYNTVTPGYLETIEVPLIRGRTFTKADVMGNAPVAIVNRAFANRFWPDGAVIGERFTAANMRAGSDLTGETATVFQIVGVVADGRYADLESLEAPYFWTAFYQNPTPQALLHVTARSTALSALSGLRQEVRLEEDEYSLILPTTHAEMISVQTAAYAAMGKVLGSGGLFGLVLVVVGIYGVVSLGVTARTREMAIHQAVGARRAHVIRNLAREGIGLSLIGTGIGAIIAALGSGVVESSIYGVSPLDPVAFAVPITVLLIAAVGLVDQLGREHLVEVRAGPRNRCEADQTDADEVAELHFLSRVPDLVPTWHQVPVALCPGSRARH